MQVPVAIESTGMGGFRAESVPPFSAVAEGSTREEAVSLKDNPLLDEWRAAMEEFRKQCDLEAGVDLGKHP